MEFRPILELLALSGIVAALGVLTYFYFTKDSVRNAVNKGLQFLPFITRTLAAVTPDTKGVFDKHDALVLLGRTMEYLKQTLTDPANTSFEQVEGDLYDFLRRELDRYNKAGVKGVPNVDDLVLKNQVRLVFEQIKRVLSEDTSRNDS